MRFFPLLAAFFPGVARASIANVSLPAIGGVTPGSAPASFVTYLFVGATFFVGVVAVIALVWGGATYLLAAGDPGKAAEGKERIQHALLGLILVFAAATTLYTINPDLVRLRDVSLPLVSLPQAAPPLLPGVPGSCQITAVAWDRAQVCLVSAAAYGTVSLSVQGQNCDGWGVALNIVNKSTGATVWPISSIFRGDFAAATWNPCQQSSMPACPSSIVDGTYYFDAIAGSGNVTTQARSGDLVVASRGTCVTGPACTSTVCPAVTTAGSKCTVAYLTQAGCFAGHECAASGICRAESSGIETAPSTLDICNCGPNSAFPSGCDGKVFSWGLFQINLTKWPMSGLDCPSAFQTFTSPTGRTNLYYDRGARTYWCSVKTDQASQFLYNQCVSVAKLGDQNIQKACEISRNGTDWSAWSVNATCGF